MSTHRQQQQGDQAKKRTWLSRRNVVIATIVIVALLITTACSGAQIYSVWAFTWIIKLAVIKYGSTSFSQA